jgi:sigma-E factor negative regulatory protein RseB
LYLWGGVIGLLLVQGLSQADDAKVHEVRELLERMSRAMRTLNYEGRLVYAHSGALETMQIIHSYQDGRERERLVHLNGTPREIIRDDQRVTCLFPDKHTLVLKRSGPRLPFHAGPVITDFDALTHHYHFSFSSSGRIAGQATRKIVISAADAYRYGYVLWIAEDSDLLLRSDLVGADQQPLEQIIFVSLERKEVIAPAELEAPAIEGDWRRVEHVAAAEQPEDRSWTIAWLPDGFKVRTRTLERLGRGPEPVYSVGFSDGLASLSVYIETPPQTEPGEFASGATNMGAAHAYTRLVGEYAVTAVGAVPAVTVRQVAESVHRQSPEGAP